MRISDWSSDVCSSDLSAQVADQRHIDRAVLADRFRIEFDVDPLAIDIAVGPQVATAVVRRLADFGTDGDDDVGLGDDFVTDVGEQVREGAVFDARSEEHTSELQSLMRISYAVLCLKKKKTKHHTKIHTPHITYHEPYQF